MSFSGSGLQPLWAARRLLSLMENIKASALNVLWIPNPLWHLLHSVSYLPYKEPFYKRNKITKRTNKSVPVIQVTWRRWGLRTAGVACEKMVHLRSEVSVFVSISTSVRREKSAKRHSVTRSEKHKNAMCEIHLHSNDTSDFKIGGGDIFPHAAFHAKYRLRLTAGLRKKMEFHQSITSTETFPLA